MSITTDSPSDMSDLDRQTIEEFRANGGKVGGRYTETQLLLLTTIGAKSGQRRTKPLVYLPDGDRFIVLAIAPGSPHHPGWYYNLLASPKATVEVGTETFDVTAIFTKDEERDQLFTRVAARYPQVLNFQAKTTRPFPVIALTKASLTA